MRFNIVPRRSADDRRSEARFGIATTAFFAAVSLIGLGLFFYGGDVPPVRNSTWSTLRWIALLVGAVSVFLTIQSLFETAIAATIGPERAIAIMAVLLLIGAFLEWLL